MEPRLDRRPASLHARLALAAACAAAALLVTARPASAQLEPLLFLQRNQPNVILALDVSARMQFDANGNYFDPYDYPRTGAAWENTLGVPAGAATYRRMYQTLLRQPPASSDAYTAALIQTMGSNNPLYSAFWSRTRLAVARAGLMAAVQANARVARFGLLKMRQMNPRVGERANEGPVYVTSSSQVSPTPSGANDGRWRLTSTEVDTPNGTIGTAATPIVAADAAGASTSVATILSRAVNQAGGLIPAGRDTDTAVDAPVARLIDDARAEAARLIAADRECRNTVVILVVGGGEGTTVSGADPAARAGTFLNIGGRRVPIYVIAIAPPAASVATLQAIAENSGGGYYEITRSMIEAVPPGMPVPEVSLAANAAVQHAFAAQADVDTAPTALLPRGPQTEWQTASPIVGTVNLENAKDITGLTLPNTVIYTPAGTKVPQRANVMITAGMALPGFEGRLRGFRMYKPEADATKPYGWAFVTAGTRLWVSTLPAPDQRNIFTTRPDGQMVALSVGNAAALAPYLTSIDAAGLIQQVRSQPLGAIIDSTPAILDPPSLDPPPDPDYPGFAADNVNRRSLIFVGANDGMMHAFDARTGLEVWAYVPFNLLPKLRALREGQPVGSYKYFVDSSAKVADVKVGGQWRTYLMFGQGPGGTFYQTLDVTLTGLGTAVAPDSDDTAALLSFFNQPNRIPLVWSFPTLAAFDAALLPYGDIATGAPAIHKTVGETWSDPAVGQVESSSSDWVALVGSGFLTRSRELALNRLGTTAGTTFYMLKMEDGTLIASQNVGSDGAAETVDNCAVANDCRRMKNALQADPVATGPPNTRYISKAYIGDLDGRVWRFNLGLGTGGDPEFTSAPIMLFDATNTHPIFSSMASVNVGGSQDYLFFASGSDALPSNGVSQSYKLFGVLDTSGTGVQKFAIPLESVDGAAGDEKPSTFPAVAGEITFFSTTTFYPLEPCREPTANLYALTFLGGAAYDTNDSGSVTATDSTKIRSVNSGKATAPFVVDQHLVFAAGGKVEILGDPRDYNNGFGQVGVRILSWRPRQ
jgi:outer membrane protein assembly factor BamB